MIKNERQYKITRSRVEKFKETLSNFESTKKISPHVDPRFHKLERDALQGQLLTLEREIQEYEDLKTGKIPIMELLTFEDLPTTLIKSRIALGLSQKDLAERIGLPEQQIQRYESTDYESASMSRIKEIINVLQLEIEKLGLPRKKVDLKLFFKKLANVGLDQKFITKRILTPSLVNRIDRGNDFPELLSLQAASYVGRVFGWETDQILGTDPLTLEPIPVKFKVPKTANTLKVHAYSVYAHYIAILMAQATSHLKSKTIPTNPYQMREEILSSYSTISFRNLIDYAWKLGIPVMGLDPTSFHSACFRSNDKSVIVLTQKTSSEARLMFNLIHELYHAISGLERIDFENELDNSEDEEERLANQFAHAVLLGKNADSLLNTCLENCVVGETQNLSFLKKSVERVASEEKVRVDVLANYIAHRLSSEKIFNWWGVAENLQKPLKDARVILRDAMLEYADLSTLSPPDLELLKQALSTEEVTDGE
ncbi:MAG: ImmA/IrrE family metallo-endopeptidase [Thaumarchaeota archaeon]|nr:ImmA/IrrE family metallo-endopeptidase [Nitrososphaerota archaeon]